MLCFHCKCTTRCSDCAGADACIKHVFSNELNAPDFSYDYSNHSYKYDSVCSNILTVNLNQTFLNVVNVDKGHFCFKYMGFIKCIMKEPLMRDWRIKQHLKDKPLIR